MDDELKKFIHREIANASVKILMNDKLKGTGFFITPDGYIITAYHCIGDYPPEIVVQTRFGEKCVVTLDGDKSLKNHDIAVLKVLKDNYRTPHYIPLGRISGEHWGEDIVTMGYPAGNLPDNEEMGVFFGHISRFTDKNKIEIPNAIKGGGHSGGPIYHYKTQRIIGLAQGARQAETMTDTGLAVWFDMLFEKWAEFEKINEEVVRCWEKRLCNFQNSSSFQFITLLEEVADLKGILGNIKVSDTEAQTHFEQVIPDNRGLPEYVKGDLFESILNLLPQKKHEAPDDAPLLEFLERCEITDYSIQTKLDNWKNRVAQSLKIDLGAIRAKIKRQKIETLRQPTHKPILLIKIAPNFREFAKEPEFNIQAWLFQSNEWKQYRDIEQIGQTRHKLEQLIPEIITTVVDSIGKAANALMIEVMLPLELFDWKVHQIKVQVRRHERPLCNLYPLIIRSYERLYDRDYVFAKGQWEDKWTTCASCKITDTDKLYWVCCEDEYCEIVVEELEDSALVFLALTQMPPTNEREQMLEIMSTIVEAGLPFAFWTIQAPTDIEAWREQIGKVLQQFAPKDWPQQIKQCCREETKAKSEQFWHHINVLWDNPERLPPDVGYSLTSEGL